jgi:hypothetical protein
MEDTFKEKLDKVIETVLCYLGYYYVRDKYYDLKQFTKNVIHYRKELTHDVSTWQCEGMLVFNKKYLQGALEELGDEDCWHDSAQNRKDIKRCIFLIDELLYNSPNFRKGKVFIELLENQFNETTVETQSAEQEHKPSLSDEEQTNLDYKNELFTLLTNYDKWWV